MELVPPLRFACVEENLYRGAYPLLRNFNFLKRLGVKSILSLIPEDPTKDLKSFCKHEGITNYVIKADRFKGEPQLLPSDVNDALNVLLNYDNYPLYVHCLDGRHITGIMIMALRKVMFWDYQAAFQEFLRFTKERDDMQVFFSDILGDILAPTRLPPWLFGPQPVIVLPQEVSVLDVLSCTSSSSSNGSTVATTGATTNSVPVVPYRPPSLDMLISSADGKTKRHPSLKLRIPVTSGASQAISASTSAATTPQAAAPSSEDNKSSSRRIAFGASPPAAEMVMYGDDVLLAQSGTATAGALLALGTRMFEKPEPFPLHNIRPMVPQHDDGHCEDVKNNQRTEEAIKQIRTKPATNVSTTSSSNTGSYGVSISVIPGTGIEGTSSTTKSQTAQPTGGGTGSSVAVGEDGATTASTVATSGNRSPVLGPQPAPTTPPVASSASKLAETPLALGGQRGTLSLLDKREKVRLPVEGYSAVAPCCDHLESWKSGGKGEREPPIELVSYSLRITTLFKDALVSSAAHEAERRADRWPSASEYYSNTSNNKNNNSVTQEGRKTPESPVADGARCTPDVSTPTFAREISASAVESSPPLITSARGAGSATPVDWKQLAADLATMRPPTADVPPRPDYCRAHPRVAPLYYHLRHAPSGMHYFNIAEGEKGEKDGRRWLKRSLSR